MIFGPRPPNTHTRQPGSPAARKPGIAAAVIAVVVVVFIVAIVVVAAAAAAAVETLKGAHWP